MSSQSFRPFFSRTDSDLLENPVQATDKKSSPHEHPARSIDAEERRSTRDESLDENVGEPHPAA